MRLIYFVLITVFVAFSVAYPFVMTNDKLIIDFSPSTTNLLYGLFNVAINPNPPYLSLVSSYGYFKVTNIEIPTNELSFFDTVIVSCELNPGTKLYVDVLNSQSGYIIARGRVEYPQKATIIDLKEVSKNVREIGLVFSYDTSLSTGGKVNSIMITKSFVLENSISDDDIIVYPNPFIRSPQGIVNISLKLSSVNRVSIVVFDSKGNVVKTFLRDFDLEDKIYNFSWDLRDDRGREVSSGTYVVFAKIGEKVITKRLYVVR